MQELKYSFVSLSSLVTFFNIDKIAYKEKIVNNVSSTKNTYTRAAFPKWREGFLGRKEYAERPDIKLTTKLQMLLCLECSIWQVFFRKSFTDSNSYDMMDTIHVESLFDGKIVKYDKSGYGVNVATAMCPVKYNPYLATNTGYKKVNYSYVSIGEQKKEWN